MNTKNHQDVMQTQETSFFTHDLLNELEAGLLITLDNSRNIVQMVPRSVGEKGVAEILKQLNDRDRTIVMTNMLHKVLVKMGSDLSKIAAGSPGTKRDVSHLGLSGRLAETCLNIIHINAMIHQGEPEKVFRESLNVVDNLFGLDQAQSQLARMIRTTLWYIYSRRVPKNTLRYEDGYIGTQYLDLLTATDPMWYGYQKTPHEANELFDQRYEFCASRKGIGALYRVSDVSDVEDLKNKGYIKKDDVRRLSGLIEQIHALYSHNHRQAYNPKDHLYVIIDKDKVDLIFEINFIPVKITSADEVAHMIHRIASYYDEGMRRFLSTPQSDLNPAKRIVQQQAIVNMRKLIEAIALPKQGDLLSIIPMLSSDYFRNPAIQKRRKNIAQLIPEVSDAIKKSIQEKKGEISAPADVTKAVAQDTQEVTGKIIAVDRSHQDRHESVTKKLGITPQPLDINIVEGHVHRKSTPGAARGGLKSQRYFASKVTQLIHALEERKINIDKDHVYMINDGKMLVIYTPGSTILVSDILGSTTHVFQEKIPLEVLRQANGDMTNLSKKYVRIGINDATFESQENMQSWSDRVLGSLQKSVPHFGDLIPVGISQTEINTQMTHALRSAWNERYITSEHLISTQSIIKWIIAHNTSVRDGLSTLKPIVTKEGKVPDIQSIIVRLGGSQYFAYYRGAITHYLTPYITALFSADFEAADSLYLEAKSKHQSPEKITEFLRDFQGFTSEDEVRSLFSFHDKQKASDIRRRYQIPRGLYQVDGWLINMGIDLDMIDHASSQMSHLDALIQTLRYKKLLSL